MGKRSLMACLTRCKCSIEAIRNSVKVKLRIDVVKFMKSRISLEVTVTGQGSEYKLTFVKGRLHSAE